MFNSVGHVIYDVHFEGELTQGVPNNSSLSVELFEFAGHVYSVFVKDYALTVYRDYQQIMSQNFVDSKQERATHAFKPLQLIFDREFSELVLLAIASEAKGKEVMHSSN